ncbi:ABC transporter permease [Caproicibacter fermentans]|uniref:ABC transporter permease n=1 Tax=Caproicibacter fermentans TaxID=2576756 RepID=A0A7G8T9A4_9FIRM|nr:ABC transporter permease [Caproicibacter fermentans]QNK40195.1 ABC transporter permease [Caproicibacter fermentans]
MRTIHRLEPHGTEKMKDFRSLKFLDRMRPVFEAFGVEYPVMRKIIRIKLVMDGRRVPTVIGSGRSEEEGSSSYRSSLLAYGLIGLFIGLMMIVPMPLFLQMNIVLGMLLFMIMTTMISDFSSVLLDLKDKSILLTRPVNLRTLNAAKLVHIVIYLLSITAAMSGVSLVAGLIRHGVWFFLLFLFELILICGFVILFTSILYFIILHFFSGEKLKDIINYFQIALSVFMTVGYQLIGRLFDFKDLHFTPLWWNFLLPSAWFAAPFSLLVDHDFNIYYILLTAAGIVISVTAIILYLKVAAPVFEKNLQKLNNSAERGHVVKKHSLQQTVSNVICRSRLERAFFTFSARMLKNERKLKLRLYPNITFAMIFPFIFLLNFLSGGRSFAQALAEIKGGDYFLFLYLSAMLLAPMIVMLGMSENYKGSWIYRVMPIGSPGEILKGAAKAFIYKYIFPVFFFAGLIFSAIYGAKIIPDIILIFLNTLILMLLISGFSKKELPFCKDFQYTQNGSNLGLMILSMALSGAFAGVHFMLLRFFSPGIYLFIALSIGLILILWHTAFKVTWREIAGNA